MYCRSTCFLFVLICVVLLAIQLSSSTAFISSPDINSQYSKVISDLKETVVKSLGFQAEDFKISGFDLRDALVGRSVAYEFDIEIGKKVLPLKLMEDTNRWEYVDLPIFRVEDPLRPGDEYGLVERGSSDVDGPVLAPFQLAGPMELWIQDAKDMRISLPNDVDAGELKKVILAEGAVVSVKGARSVSLRHPVELPLPLNQSSSGFASGLLALAEYLRHVSRAGDSIISLRIVGPTSLTSPASLSSSSSNNKLKLKRLAPGLVVLSSASKIKAIGDDSAIDIQGDVTSLLTPNRFTTLWPVTSINGSNSNLLGIETLLTSLLGSNANKQGSFKLLKADVSAQTFMKIGFVAVKRLKEGDGFDVTGFPAWRTKPETVRMHFEVLAKIDGNKVVPERILRVNPVEVEDTIAPNVVSGNMTLSKIETFYPPPNPFLL